MKKFFYVYGFFCIVGFAKAVWEDVAFIPDITEYYIVPAFSQNSTTQDFTELHNYLSSFLQIPNVLNIYANGKTISCRTSSSKQVDFPTLGAYQCVDINNMPKLIEEVYENCVTENVAQLLTRAYLYVLNENTASTENQRKKIRTNVIILTDLSFVEEGFYDRISIYLQETLFFIFSNAKENNQENLYPAHQSVQYFYTSGNVPKEAISQIIVNETLTYRLSTSVNKYNVFIVGDETILDYALKIAENLLQQSDWGNLWPTLYVAALKKNESFYYQSVAIHLNNTQFSPKKLSTRYRSTSKTFSTDLLESFLKKVYNRYTGANNDFIQWNIIITDSFPLWLKNTELIFDSFQHHLDIYLLTNNNTYKNLLTDLSQNINEIILDDENSTLRSNHIILQDASIAPNFEYYPTLKKRMLASTFDYRKPITKKQNRWWTWLIVGCSLAIILAAFMTYLFYCRRKYSKTDETHRPFSPSILSQIPETTTEKQKLLFIDEEYLQIHFNKILGHGTSSLVYEGFLNRTSPVAQLCSQMETSDFGNSIVAIKAATTINKYELEQVFREVNAALKIGYHRHICCLLGWTLYQKIPTLILEYVNGTNLHTWIQTTSEQKFDKIIAKILWQISDAMEHISVSGIVHKDLAARNILLNEMLEVKVTDFGLSSMLDEKQHIYQAQFHRRLPLRWMAIEALKDRIFSEVSDVWSFGVLIWEIYNNGDIPYGEMEGNEIVEFLTAGGRLELSKVDRWKMLLIDCWKEEKQERPKFTEIKKQLESFLNEEDVKYGYIKCLSQT